MTFTVGLDLDGTTADYYAGLRSFAAQEMNLPASAFPDPRAYSLVQSGWPFGNEAAFRSCHAAAVADGVLRQLPIYSGAAEAIQRMQEAGVAFHVITHRISPDVSPVRVIEDTTGWLSDHGVGPEAVSFTGDKHLIDVDVFVDDAPYQLDALAAAGRTAIVFDQKYNRDRTEVRAGNWVELEQIILAMHAGAEKTSQLSRTS